MSPTAVAEAAVSDMLSKEWKTWDQQIAQVDEKVVERANHEEPGEICNATQNLMTAAGVSHYSRLTLSSRIGPIERFPRPRSPANYFSRTPRCRNSGNAQDRLGPSPKKEARSHALSWGSWRCSF